MDHYKEVLLPAIDAAVARENMSPAAGVIGTSLYSSRPKWHLSKRRRTFAMFENRTTGEKRFQNFLSEYHLLGNARTLMIHWKSTFHNTDGGVSVRRFRRGATFQSLTLIATPLSLPPCVCPAPAEPGCK